MRIALIGYGKMGRMIEEVAMEKGHQIVLRIDADNQNEFNTDAAKGADVAIEFTGPSTALQNVKRCIDYGLPVVSGSTGWNAQLEEAKAYCVQKNGSFLHASNFSIGVNIFFALNKYLAQMMNNQKDYEVSLKEIHHTHKLDAPSGTAVTLAEGILAELGRKKNWVNALASDPAELSIVSERIDPAPGTHHVLYSSPIDDIEIIHTAHNRKGFAAGAVLAAEFIATRKGVWTMNDVLGF